ncbi:MAG TPA: hypothetical protein VLB83_01490, partial [Candidatus Paceibacterota bacterium]|nr:hypothetical protein [Candidatus Paceibacterota bacterium]
METPQNGAQQGGVQHEDEVWTDPEKAGKATLDALEAYLQTNPIKADAEPEASAVPGASEPKRIPVMSVRSFEDLQHLGIQTVEASSAPVAHEEVAVASPVNPAPEAEVASAPVESAAAPTPAAEISPAEPARVTAADSAPSLESVPAPATESKEDPANKEIESINETLTGKFHTEAMEARRAIRDIERARKKGETVSELELSREKEARETLDRYMSAVGRARKHVALFDAHTAGGIVLATLVGAYEKAGTIEDEQKRNFLKHHSKRMFVQALETQGFGRAAAESVFGELVSQSREAARLSEQLAREGETYRLRKSGHHANVLRWQGISVKDLDPNAPVPKEVTDALAKAVDTYRSADPVRAVEARRKVAAARDAYRAARTPSVSEATVADAAPAPQAEEAPAPVEAAPSLGEELEAREPTPEEVAQVEAHEHLADVEENAAQKDDAELLETPAYSTVPGYAYGECVVVAGMSGAVEDDWKVVAMKKDTGMVVVRKGANRREIPLGDLNAYNEVSSDAAIPEEHLERSAEEEHLRNMSLEYDESMRRLEAMLPDAEQKGAIDLVRSVEEALAKREAEYRDAVLAYKAEHAEVRTGSENEKGKLERWYDHMIAEAEEKGDAGAAENYKKRKADYLAAVGGTIVAAGAAAGSLEAPSLPAEAFAGPIDPEILARAEKEFKFSKEELEAVPEFTSLSAGQQALVLRNLNQYSVQQIQGEALKHYREKMDSLSTPLSKEQQTYLSERVSTPRTWWRRFAVAAEQIAKKETWKRAGMNLMKDKWLADEEKQLAEKLSSEGAPDRVELVRSLALLAKEGPDAEVGERGELRLKFVSERDFGGNLSEEERSRVNAFNAAAQAFMEAKKPDLSGAELDQAVSGKVNKALDSVSAFVTGRASRDGADKQKFTEAKSAYEKALHEMLELKRVKTGDEAAVMDTLEIDRAITFNQFFNTDPGAERMLADIKDQSSWMRWAKSSSRLRLGSFAVGGATRVVAAGTLATLGGGAVAGLLAAPLAGYGVGRMMGRQRARTDLEEKEVLAKMGVAERERASREKIAAIKAELAQIPEDTKDPAANERRIALARELGTVAFEADKTSRHIVNAGALAEKITKLEDRLAAIDEALANGAPSTPEIAKERDLIVRRLDARYTFTKEKIDKGLIDFGAHGAEGIANQYRLLKALGGAAATASVEQKWDSDLKNRLAKFLSYSEKAVTVRQAEFLDRRGKQAAKIGAAFAAAGAFATDVAASASTGRGVTAQFFDLGDDEGATPEALAPEVLAAIRASRSAEGMKEIPGILETLPEEQVRAIQSEMQIGEIRGIAGSPEVIFKMPNGNLSNAASLPIAKEAFARMQAEAAAAAQVAAPAPAAPAVAT